MFLSLHHSTGEYQNGNEPWDSLNFGELLGYLSSYYFLTDTAPCVVKALSPEESRFYQKNHTTVELAVLPGKSGAK